MYQLVSAIAKPIDGATRWQDVEIGTLTFIDIFATYSKVFVVLTNPFIDHPVSLDLAELRGEQSSRDITFNAFLAENGNTTLPTSDTIPKIDTKTVKYADGIHAGYDILPVHDLYAPTTELPAAEKTSLFLTKAGLDYDLFLRSCLVSVNGFFHLTDGNIEGIRVMRGNVSRQLSLHASLGIYSFREVGSLEFIPITPDMLYKQSEEGHYYQQMYIDIKKDVGNRTVLLVLGGYLHVMDSTYYRVGDTQFAIDFQNFPLAKRIYESRPYLDLSSLGLETTLRNKTMLAVGDLQSDSVLAAYATLPQSFFVVVDSDDLYVELDRLEDTGVPGLYVSHVKPLYPLRTGFGKMSEYWPTLEDGEWAINVEEVTIPNYNFQTVDASLERNIDETRESYKADSISPAFFMRICKDV